MLLAIAMVMVLFENERNAVQENALAFSTLGVDPRRLLSASDLVPACRLLWTAGGAAAFPPRRIFRFRSNGAGRAALGAEGFFGRVPGEAAEDAGRRLHRRTGLPARRRGHVPGSGGDGRAAAGAFAGGRFEACKQTLLGGRNHRPDGGEPANAGAQFWRASCSRTRNGGCSALRICGC